MFYRIFIIFFVFILTLSSYGMDDPYTQALNFRDGKVAGYTKNESIDEAEKLFKALGAEGNPKAIHNYAMIQYNKKNYELAYEWFQKAAATGLDVSINNAEKMLKEGKVKKVVHLVIGTTRNQHVTSGPIIDAIYNHKATKLSHLDTFGGKAISVDLRKCAIEGADHIVADARTLDVSNFIIDSVFIEKISTICDVSSADFERMITNFNHLQENYVGAVIKNISKSMKAGTTLEMEWLPYFGLYSYDQDELDKYIVNNPFHSFLNMNVMLQAIFILGGDHTNLKILPIKLHEPTLKMVENVRSLLNFYHQQGVGESFDDLLGLVYWEARVFLEMMKRNSHIILNYNVINQNAAEIKEAFKNSKCNIFPSHLIGKKVSAQDEISKEIIEGFIYDISTVLTRSFLNFMVSDIAAEYNRPQVIKYLETIGFNAVSIDKGDNPHNGRENVWMIRAKKR